MAFDDPQNQYEKLFDGYRVLIQLPKYVSSFKKTHFMPDFWGVFELNYEGAPNIWGRSPTEVLDNVERWDAQYVIVYQEDEINLDLKWTDAGFEVMTSFDWKKYECQLNETLLPMPVWWLLKVPSRR